MTPQQIIFVLIVVVGLFSARRLQRRLRREADLVFVTPRKTS